MTRNLHRAAREYETAAGSLAAAVKARLLGVVLWGEALAKVNATTRPRVRAGILRRSIRGMVEVENSTTVLSLSAGKDGTVAERYAALQEYGGTVTPKRGRYLAIPFGAALTGAGVPRYRSPRDVPDLHMVRGKGGNPVLGRTIGTGKGARFEGLFALVRRSQVPETRFIGRAMDAIRDEARAEAGKAVRDAVEGAGHAQ